MSVENIRVNQRGTWKAEVRHVGLNKYRVVTGESETIVRNKAYAQLSAWEEIWGRRNEKEKELKQRAKEKNIKERKKAEKESELEQKEQLAAQKTMKAQESLENIQNIWKSVVGKKIVASWEIPLEEPTFIEPKLLSIEYAKSKPEESAPKKAEADDPRMAPEKYLPKFNFFDKLMPSLKIKKSVQAKEAYEKACLNCDQERRRVEQENQKMQEQYRERLEKWEKDRETFIAEKTEKNKKLLFSAKEEWEVECNKVKKNNDERKEKQDKYAGKDIGIFIEKCKTVLRGSKYPIDFKKEFDIDYNPESKSLIIDYLMPPKEALPDIESVKYSAKKDSFENKDITDSAINKMYDNLLYQVSLRTIYELYKSDTVKLIDSIVFNGCVRFVNKANGKKVESCILSIQAGRKEFLDMNFKDIDPQAWFRTFKGVGSSKLHGLAPVAPIMKINRNDKRFITPYGVAGTIEETTNIAAMDWQDFENLIREIFEKEFSAVNGEVKITQASRDGGVDAVIFDPDPIRGGKIIVQAKRYTNIVGVSAVRDLFGTVMNEGASKGILVTTTDYGPDAYNFAKDKPLTLINGGNLLYLLEKHGHKARIDIKEAKKIFKDIQRDEQEPRWRSA